MIIDGVDLDPALDGQTGEPFEIVRAQLRARPVRAVGGAARRIGLERAEHIGIMVAAHADGAPSAQCVAHLVGLGVIADGIPAEQQQVDGRHVAQDGVERGLVGVGVGEDADVHGSPPGPARRSRRDSRR